MSIVEEALSRLQEKKNEERTDSGDESGGRRGDESEMVADLQALSRKKPWSRTWLLLFLGLFVLAGLSGGVFWWLADFEDDSTVVVRQPPESFPLPEIEAGVEVDSSALEDVPAPKDTSLQTVSFDTETGSASIVVAEADSSLLKPKPVKIIAEVSHPVDAASVSMDEKLVALETIEVENEVSEPVLSRETVPDEVTAEQAFVVDKVVPDILEKVEGLPETKEKRQEFVDPFMYVKKMIARGDYEEAIDHLGPLVEFNPEDWETWFWLGTAHLGLNQLPEASRALDEALARNGESAQIWIQRAIVAQQQEKHHLALQLLYEAQRHGPDMPEIYLNKGFSFEILGRLEGATRNYQAFLELSEGNAAFMNQRRKVIQWLIQREGKF